MNTDSPKELRRSKTEKILPAGPGARLRQARELARLSQADVAKQLYLRMQLIEAIENDDYITMPGITFTQGYLRAYANLLNLPGDEIIEAFRQLDVPKPAASLIHKPMEQHSLPAKKRSLMRWATFSVVTMLVGLTVIWGYNQVQAVSNRVEVGPVVSTTVAVPVAVAKAAAPVAATLPPKVATIEPAAAQAPTKIAAAVAPATKAASNDSVVESKNNSDDDDDN